MLLQSVPYELRAIVASLAGSSGWITPSTMSLQAVPYEAVLNAPATAVLALIAVVVVVALVLLLRALVAKRNGNGNSEEIERLWKEIDLLRRRSHRHASKITTLLLRARIPEDDNWDE